MAYPTESQIDAAVPANGTPSRALTNGVLKAITANATFLPDDGTVPLRSVENENFSGGRIKASSATDPDDVVILVQMESAIPTWTTLADKPASFPPSAHTHPASAISDSSAVGRSVVTAASAAAARTAIGAGTSSLAIGTTNVTAKAGDYQPTWAQVTGKPGLLVEAAEAPATPASPGVKGQFFLAVDMFYVCVATDTWRSVGLTEW